MGSRRNGFPSSEQLGHQDELNQIRIASDQATSMRSSSTRLKTSFVENKQQLDGDGSRGSSGSRSTGEIRYSARARNGGATQVVETDIASYQTEDDLDAILVDGCAVVLASLDKRACAQAQMTDANSLLEELLLPMSLPWSNPKEAAYRVIPRDIDDLPGLLTMEDDVPGQEIHGKFGRLRGKAHAKNSMVAARRSNDPGVVELTTFPSQTKAQQHRTFLPSLRDPLDGDLSTPGEISLRTYHTVQARKRKRDEVKAANRATKLVSFRLASTSSRATLFGALEEERTPLFAIAVFPRFIQEGIKAQGLSEWNDAVELGSYNHRVVPSVTEMSNDPMTSNRFIVGRTRLIWTEKENPCSQSQRPAVRSILSGERLEPTAFKRPLRAKVAIRLNDKLLTVKKKSVALPEVHETVEVPTKEVGDAIDEACLEESTAPVDHAQCCFENDSLDHRMFEVDNDSRSRQASLIYDLIRAPIPVDSKTFLYRTAGSSSRLQITPPRLDCVRTEDGLVVVVCSTPGLLTWAPAASNGSISTNARLLNELVLEVRRCTVCWTVETDQLSDAELKQCTSCRVRAHASCLGIASQMSESAWTCQACQPMQAQTDMLCRVCRHSNGLLESDAQGWIHNMCRTWCNRNQEPDAVFASNEMLRCDLCSAHSISVVSCAAENCSVQFHPMCAAIVSAGAEATQKGLSRSGAGGSDAFLCTQYTLSLLQTSFIDGPMSLVNDTTALPVAFCGYHNPKRQTDGYGLHPVGLLKGSALRIPPKRGNADNTQPTSP